MQDVFDASHDPAFIANAVKKCVTESNKKRPMILLAPLCSVLTIFYHKKAPTFHFLLFRDRFPAFKKRLARVEIKSKF